MLAAIGLWLSLHPYLAPLVIPAVTGLVTLLFGWAAENKYAGPLVKIAAKLGLDATEVSKLLAAWLQSLFTPPKDPPCPPAPPPAVPGALTNIGPIAAAALMLALCVLTGCSWLDAHGAIVPDAGKLAICVLENRKLPVDQIAVRCGADSVAVVDDILMAHASAEHEDAKVGACK